jgi:hypothetical protein
MQLLIYTIAISIMSILSYQLFYHRRRCAFVIGTVTTNFLPWLWINTYQNIGTFIFTFTVFLKGTVRQN